MLGDELEDVLAGCLDKFWAEKNIMADIVNARHQTFQPERRPFARQGELTGVLRQATALQE
jgi:hypothetical protein